MTSLEKRIDELESRLVFQDDLLQSLNDVIAAQQSRLDRTERQLAALNAVQQQLLEGQRQFGSDEPPPHY